MCGIFLYTQACQSKESVHESHLLSTCLFSLIELFLISRLLFILALNMNYSDVLAV